MASLGLEITDVMKKEKAVRVVLTCLSHVLLNHWPRITWIKHGTGFTEQILLVQCDL